MLADNCKFFTVFTPTYNRAYRLGKLFESLCAQTFCDFEWVIVDDGSVDDTEELVKYFALTAKFPIIYEKTINGGKHRATNVGIKLAKGKWFANVDSDDYLEKDALQIINNTLSQVKSGEIVSTVIALDRFANGDVIGEKFTQNLKDYVDMVCCGIHGDKFIILFTEFLKQNPFKEFSGEKFITESSLFFQYAQKYSDTRTMFINKPLYIAEYLPDGLTKHSFITRVNSVNGCLYSYLLFWRVLKHCKMRWRYAINYYRFLFHGRDRGAKFDDEVLSHEIPIFFACFGYFLYLKDRVGEIAK